MRARVLWNRFMAGSYREGLSVAWERHCRMCFLAGLALGLRLAADMPESERRALLNDAAAAGVEAVKEGGKR